MLDVGFSELLVFGIIALLVLGPEKLPQAARSTAKGYGKFKRFVGTIQNEIDQQLNLSELRQEMQAEINRISELERRMTQQFADLQSNLAAPLLSPDTANQSTYLWVHLPHLNTPYTLDYQRRLILVLSTPVETEAISSVETTVFDASMLAVETAVAAEAIQLEAPIASAETEIEIEIETVVPKEIVPPEAMTTLDETVEEIRTPETVTMLEEKIPVTETMPSTTSTTPTLKLVV